MGKPSKKEQEEIKKFWTIFHEEPPAGVGKRKLKARLTDLIGGLTSYYKIPKELNKKRCFVCGTAFKGEVRIPLTINGTFLVICSGEKCVKKINKILLMVNTTETMKVIDKIFHKSLKEVDMYG